MFPTATGIVNLGNTCYLNTALQSLASCTNFMKDITILKSTLKQEFNECADTRTKKILKIRYNLINIITNISLDSGKKVIYVLNIYCQVQGNIGIVSHIHQQQDSHEMFILLSNIIYNEKTIPSMYVRIRSKLECTTCNFIRDIKGPEDNIYNTVLPLKPKEIIGYKNLVKLGNTPQSFNYYFNQYEILDENNKVECEKCSTKTKTINHQKVTMLRDIVVILLPYRDNFPITNGNEIGLHNVIKVDRLDGIKEYQLVSVANQSGNMYGGHWFGTFRRSDGMYGISDITTCKVNSINITQNTVYCIYHIM